MPWLLRSPWPIAESWMVCVCAINVEYGFFRPWLGMAFAFAFGWHMAGKYERLIKQVFDEIALMTADQLEERWRRQGVRPW